MRLRVRHATTCAYDEPAFGVIQALRVTPSNHEGQQVLNWRVDVDVDGLLRASRDAFGNVLHLFYAEKPVTELTVRVSGEVELRDTAGVVRGAREPFVPEVYLRATQLTTEDAELVAWARSVGGADALAGLHRLMAELHQRMCLDTAGCGAVTTAAEAFREGHGGCQDYAHIFITAARSCGLPARYVSGHLCSLGQGEQEAAHAWAEAYIPDIGWTGFDPTNGVRPNQSYLRVAIGLDYLDAAPLRGARRGGGQERLRGAGAARDTMRQRQS